MISVGLKMLLIGAGAVLGAWARYGLEQVVHTSTAVWIINTSSCFIMGLGVAWLTVSTMAPTSKEAYHLLLLYGFVGGYATFAHYIFYCVDYFREGQVGMSLIYFASSLLAGLVCMVAGMWVGSKM